MEHKRNDMRVNDTEYARLNITGKEHKEFHNDFFILLNVAVGGTWAGRPDATTSFPQKMCVDWIRYYEKS
jgi:beta-glucanase (GH16 family)